MRCDFVAPSAAIAEAYEAAFDPARWPRAVAATAAAANARSAAFGLRVGSVGGKLELKSSLGLDPALMARWEQEFDAYDPHAVALERPIDAGEIVLGSELLQIEKFRAEPSYRAVYRPAGIEECAVLGLGAGCHGGSFVALHRSREMGPFAAEDLAQLRAIAPHLVHSAVLQSRLLPLLGASRVYEAVLDRLPYALFGIARDGRIALLNGAARRILDARDGVFVAAGALAVSHPETAKRFSAAVARALGGGSASRTGELFAIPRASEGAAYQALIAPTPLEASVRVFGSADTTVCAVAIVLDPEHAFTPVARAVRELFLVTPAQARLAAALAVGKSLSEHCAEANISIGTARDHVKKLFERTDTKRQSELVRKVLASVAVLEVG